MLIKSDRNRRIFLKLYAVFAAVCWLLIVFARPIGMTVPEREISFAFILINAICGMLLLDGGKIGALTVAGLGVTVVSDYFLVLRHDLLPGMIVFCVVQLFYFLRNFDTAPKKGLRIASVITAVSLAVVTTVLGAVVTKDNYSMLVFAASIYFAMLATNLVFAAIYFKQSPLFFLGLLLFLCCDVFVGLDALNDIISIPADSWIGMLATMPFNIAWLFYVPSQSLIVASLVLLPSERVSRQEKASAS